MMDRHQGINVVGDYKDSGPGLQERSQPAVNSLRLFFSRTVSGYRDLLALPS